MKDLKIEYNHPNKEKTEKFKEEMLQTIAMIRGDLLLFSSLVKRGLKWQST